MGLHRFSIGPDVHYSSVPNVHYGNVLTQSILKDVDQNGQRAENIESIFPIMLIKFAQFGFIDT